MKRFVLMVSIILCTTAFAQNKHNASTPKDPATLPLPPEKKGLVMDGKIQDSKIYPSTKRDFQVFVPKQYNGTEPACLVVGLDGNLFGAITVIDNLIATGEMPVTIGIFLQPGVSYNPDESVARYNRSNEFDRTDARLATFLEEEVIPLVENMVTPDGRKIIISKDPNDRAITGASSSGIAAFTVAWERPDMFARVYSSVGTFVAMRGGNEYPALVRKSEPRALRIFLQDGVNDTWNHIFGDWWEQNQLMASALNFAGYEFDYKWDRGTHSIYYGTRAYPDAMRWLWRGWPAKVQAGESMNGTIKSLLVKGEQWQETSAFPAQPAVDAKEISKHVKNYSRVLNLQNGDKYISNADGEIYFLKKGAKKSVKMNTLPLSGREIAIYPNGKLLVASEKNSNWLISYLVGSDGSLHSGQQFYWLHNTDNHNHTPYGNITFDTQGNLYIATPIGIQVCDQNGRVRAILPLPGKGRAVEEIAFEGNKLYARCGGKIYVRVVAHTGYNSWDAPIEVKSQGQG
ncbi:MAG: hypothetical protein IIW11_04515 [Bacteroidales bacterium]|nr:hypothetical protein [Bacteroidales bacterium]